MDKYKLLPYQMLAFQTPCCGVIHLMNNCSDSTGCSLNIAFFFKEFSEVCHLSLASTRLLLVVQKMTSR